jgi:hypothetical protein
MGDSTQHLLEGGRLRIASLVEIVARGAPPHRIERATAEM